jgi:LPXTG-motif cell wall-anchored protein
MLSTTSIVRTGAAAVAAALLSAGVAGPVVAADKSHDNTHRPANAQANHDRAHAKAAEGKAGKAAKREKGNQGRSADKPAAKENNGQGDERGNGHTPVTVCHLLGNGSYNLLTFDDNALQAHQGHGDIYPVPADGCPEGEEAPAADADDKGGDNGNGHTPVTVCHVLGNGSYIELTFDDSALDAHMAHGDLEWTEAGCPTDESTTPGDDEPVVPSDEETLLPGDESVALPGTEILGAERLVDTTAVDATQVAGVEQVAGVNRAAVATGPMAGILPSTGAAPLGLAVAAGLGLLGAGATLLVRRRAQLG